MEELQWLIYEALIFKIILQNNRYMSEVKVTWSYSILKMECNKHALFQMDFRKTRYCKWLSQGKEGHCLKRSQNIHCAGEACNVISVFYFSFNRNTKIAMTQKIRVKIGSLQLVSYLVTRFREVFFFFSIPVSLVGFYHELMDDSSLNSLQRNRSKLHPVTSLWTYFT